MIAGAVLEAESTMGWPALQGALTVIGNAARAEREAAAAFRETTDLREALWSLTIEGGDIPARQARLKRALEAEDRFDEWLEFDRAARQVTAPGAAGIADQAIAGRVPINRVVESYRYLLFGALADEIMRTRPAVRNLGLKQHWQIRQSYRALDEQVMELRQAQIAHDLARKDVPEGHRGATVGSFTDRALVEHEAGKQTRHLSIRKLVGRAAAALQALKPCFMMGPMSVAQFLPPGRLSFDLIIFDEASQVRPEEAIGAIARGRQVVVVGDANQLPPTNFFERVNLDGDDDDKRNGDGDNGSGPGVGATSESILALAEKFLPQECLRWHYRSAH